MIYIIIYFVSILPCFSLIIIWEMREEKQIYFDKLLGIMIASIIPALNTILLIMAFSLIVSEKYGNIIIWRKNEKK